MLWTKTQRIAKENAKTKRHQSVFLQGQVLIQEGVNIITKKIYVFKIISIDGNSATTINRIVT